MPRVTTFPSIKTCVKCRKKFQPKVRSTTTKYCSKECSKPPDIFPLAKLSTSTKGSVSELIVCAKLMELGFHVFRCQSPNGPFDVVAIKGDIIRKIEVRTGRLSRTGGKSWDTDYYEEANEVAVYYPQLNIVDFHTISSTQVAFIVAKTTGEK